MGNQESHEAREGRAATDRTGTERRERVPAGIERAIDVQSGARPGVLADSLEPAFRASPVALAVARDAHCRVVLRNPAMNRILPASLDWQAWRLPDGSSPPLFNAGGTALALEDQPLRRAAFAGEVTVDRALELRWPGGETLFLSVSAEPLFDAEGAPCGAVSSAIDVSAARRAEAARARVAERDDAERRDVEASSRAKDELIGLLGHELRNPMNAIATAVEVLNRAAPTAPEAQSARRIIGRQTRRLAQLMGDLGEVGRAFAEQVDYVRQPFELGALVQRCLARAAAAAEAKALRLQADLVEVRLEADADRLAQAIDRLLDDAIRWARDGACLAVRLREAPGTAGPEAVLEIRDIGEAALPPPFDPGEADPLSSPPGLALDRHGSGLGISLALVRRIVEKHGGRIDARRHDPATGGGVFVVRLPARCEAPANPALGAAPARVGLIDDNPDALLGLSALLALGGHDVVTAEDGPGGVAMLLRDAPEIAIIDIGLPGFDGFEVARRGRAGGFRGRLIAVSGYGHVSPSPQTLAAGFEAYLTKPVDSDRLSNLIAGRPD